MLQKIKDKALSHGAKMAINTQIEAYGKVQKLNLDSKNKRISMDVMLEGEREALSVHVDNYELIETDGLHQFKLNGITTSRAWINTVASTYVENTVFDITEEYSMMLNAVI